MSGSSSTAADAGQQKLIRCLENIFRLEVSQALLIDAGTVDPDFMGEQGIYSSYIRNVLADTFSGGFPENLGELVHAAERSVAAEVPGLRKRASLNMRSDLESLLLALDREGLVELPSENFLYNALRMPENKGSVSIEPRQKNKDRGNGSEARKLGRSMNFSAGSGPEEKCLRK